MKTNAVLIMCFLYCTSTSSSAQEYKPSFSRDTEIAVKTDAEREALRDTLREARSRSKDRPRIDSAKLSIEDIDSIILQKLYYSLLTDPSSFKATTEFSDAEVGLLTEKLSYFTGVVLEQHRFSLDAMCDVWDPASLEVNTMIADALAKYEVSSKEHSPITYQAMRELLVAVEIEVRAQQLDSFNEMLDVSRKELTGQSVYTFAQIVRILGDAETTLRNQCEARQQ